VNAEVEWNSLLFFACSSVVDFHRCSAIQRKMMTDNQVRPHNLRANQQANPPTLALYEAAAKADLDKVRMQERRFLCLGSFPNMVLALVGNVG